MEETPAQSTADMDPSVRPQDDFYRYCNGAWLKTHQIPSDRPADGAFYQLADLSENECREIAQDAVAQTLGTSDDGEIHSAQGEVQPGSLADNPDAKKIAIIYSQFMDEGAINEQGAAPLAPFLQSIFAASDHAELATAAGALNQLGISTFFSASIAKDMNDASRYQLYFSQAGLGLPDRSYYQDEQHARTRERYRVYVERMFILAKDYLGAGSSACDAMSAREAAGAVFDFEGTLADLHWDVVAMREIEAQNNPYAWEKIVEDNPGFAWQNWAASAGINLEAAGDISVGQVDYLQAAAKLWAQTSLETLKFWLSRKIIGFAAPYLSEPFVAEHFEMYSKTLAGTEEMRPRWKRALSLVEGLIGEALGRLYVERHFPAENKAEMENMVDDLVDAYRDSISNLTWMGEETKAEALAKLEGFTHRIGYPSKWRDYSALEISQSKTLVENIAAAQAFETDYELAKLGSPVDPEEWHMTPQTVNAYYSPLTNEIVFPAAILRPPFFTAGGDDAANYAAIGAVIGHEIGHGFDDQGSQFDAAGELRNWWTDQDRENFNKRTKALIEQYDAYSPADLGDEHTVNGALTIGENIGDLGGLTIAWKAWLKALERRGIDLPEDAPTIDGLSAPERFFASWARIWQTKYRLEYAVQLLAIDPHSPPEFRCNGVLANFDEFAKYMNVLPGDALWRAPEDRVHIW